MAILALKELDKNGKTVCVSSGEEYVRLVCKMRWGQRFAILPETYPMGFLSGKNGFVIRRKRFTETGITCMPGRRGRTRSGLTGTWRLISVTSMVIRDAFPMRMPMWRRGGNRCLRRVMPSTAYVKTAPMGNGLMNPGASTCRMMRK